MKPLFAAEDKQKARAALRQSFLKALVNLQGSKCSVNMHENTLVEGIFQGCDVNLQEFLVSALETPSGIVREAALRGGDIISIQFQDDNLKNNKNK